MKKSIVLAVILMFLSIAVLPTGESSGATITLTDWEDFNIGVNCSNDDYNGNIEWERITGQDGKIFSGDDTTSPDSTRNLRLASGYSDTGGYHEDTDIVYINTSYANDCTKIEMYLYGSIYNAFSSGFIHYDDIEFFKDGVEVLKLQLRRKQESSIKYCTLYAYDSNDIPNLIYTVSSTTLSAGILTIISKGGNLFNYSYKDQSCEEGGYTTDDWNGFDSIKLTSTDYSPEDAYGWYLEYGDIVISSEEKETSDICEYRYMSDRYSYIGNINSYCARQSYEVTVETRYNVPVSLNLTGIDLCVSSEQYSDDDDLNNYRLTINNLPMQSPVCFLNIQLIIF